MSWASRAVRPCSSPRLQQSRRASIQRTAGAGVSSATELSKTRSQGTAAPTPYGADFTAQRPLNLAEDDQGIGSFISFGSFRTTRLGDLLLTPQFDLLGPNNRLGTVDLLI